jgi:putative transposase
MKKHSHEQILLKLVRADELDRAGNSQVEICKALGVSVMTLHRWRKLPLRKNDARAPHDRAAEGKMLTNSPTMDDMRRVLEELTLENQRLRKIVTDLLLEKMRLEEASASAPAVRVNQARKA